MILGISSICYEWWPVILVTCIAARLLHNKYGRGLHRYPGPWLAAYMTIWRFLENYGRRTEWTHINLHRRYGDVVRLDPNALSFADPKAIKVIYGLNKGMVKSHFYPVQQATAKGTRIQSLFSTLDEDFHAKYRRCLNSAFAMSSLVSYEPLVNSTLDVFLEKTEELYARTGTVCDFPKWLQYFAFDVIGDLTWSKRLGFMERNEDVDGIISFINGFFDYAGPIGQMPFLDLVFQKNPLILLAQRYGVSKKVFAVTKFAQSQSIHRAPEMEKIKANGLAPGTPKDGIDLLTKFTQAQHDHPEIMSDTTVLASSVSMVFAGSETTAIALSAIFYHLMKYPSAYQKLMAELDGAVRTGLIEDRGNGTVSWAEAQKLPYLDAVIQESFRLHPAAGLTLERVVPAHGMDILGEHIPGGTIVGCNAWVLHRRPEIFGKDVDNFRPERWLEASPKQLSEMKATMFQFGAGARTCIGKNISLLEIYKLVPSFLRRFEMELQSPEQTWKTHNAWFVRQMNFMTRFKTRQVKRDDAFTQSHVR
ncbi:cytochrome P450 [Eremomyces bilateralis CBS 781.70]|uniref:Cytochrome P450 n=1 Tax=Eremomyces bilateralis CBS 781.70 TaxID=1392243 RepID=A0A6G1GEC7_9PEZI|nr:cytochrome P450 [Eremomyces bilateralis CBS 781.70]KAF1816447.1 cytochrome P450 [Eremomyces bilateralis CBS 781.70]